MTKIHRMIVPLTHKGTLEKLNKFVPATITKTLPLECKVNTFTKSGIQITVYPFLNKKQYGYILLLDCQRTPDLVKDVYENSNGFSVVFQRNSLDYPWDVELRCKIGEKTDNSFTTLFNAWRSKE